MHVVVAKLNKEPITSTLIACVGTETTFETIATGYWERFEICNETTWFMAFYMPNIAAYESLKKKCPPNTFVQPVNLKSRNIYNSIRIGVSFMPGQINLYYSNKSGYRITINKRWMITSLYQLCKNGTSDNRFLLILFIYHFMISIYLYTCTHEYYVELH